MKRVRFFHFQKSGAFREINYILILPRIYRGEAKHVEIKIFYSFFSGTDDRITFGLEAVSMVNSVAYRALNCIGCFGHEISLLYH